MEFYKENRLDTLYFFRVSIPNGMEFYIWKLGLGESLNSFNSQRDGILRARDQVLQEKRQVSIPNGMEFYFVNSSASAMSSSRFNSQRDGILRGEIG